jgi:mannosyltransferase OCH1-like enzyme
MKPKIIHQIFFEVGAKKLEDYPKFVKCSNMWKEWCNRNNYEYMFHTLEDLERVMKQEDKDLFKRVDDEKRYRFIKIDYGRLVILSHYGGIYVDMDVAPTVDKELDDLLMKYEPLVVVDKWSKLKKNPKINNWIMGCEKGGVDDFIQYCREQYEIKSKMPIYDKWVIRFFLQVSGVPCVRRFYTQKKMTHMTEDIYDYVTNDNELSWINDKDGFK